MENNFLLTDELLWDYADGFLDQEEKLRVEAYLLHDPAWRGRLEAILAEKRDFAALPLYKPQAGFADRVMAAWVAEQAIAPATSKGRDWILWAIAGAFGLFLSISFVAFVLITPQMSPVQIPTEYVPDLPKVDWTSILGNSALRYTIYLVLAFLSIRLLDRYLQQKKVTDTMRPV